MNNDKRKHEKHKQNQSIPFHNQKITTIQFNNMFSYIIDILKGDKSDFDKIKSLTLLEQNYSIAKDKMKILHLFKVLSDCFNQNEFICSPLLKGQILMTSTTILILLNVKNNNNSLFHNYVNNILIEHLKNTSNQANLYLRQITCLCLDELEIEYPGIMFGLMGQKTLEIVETGMLIGGNTIEDMKSVKSYMPFSKRCASVRDSTFLKNFEYKKLELANDGLYLLIDEERYFVFQYYLLLYSRILNHVIILYIEKKKSYSLSSSSSISLNANENKSIQSNMKDIEDEFKELNNDLNKSPNAYSNNNHRDDDDSNTFQLMDLNKNISSNDNNLYPFSRLNHQNVYIPNDQNTLLHVNPSEYQKYIDLYENTIAHNPNIQSNRLTNTNNTISLSSTQYHPELLSYINKALSYIIHLLPKTSEYIKVKIWEMLSYIISNIEINQIALLPHFNYFHLNNSSQVLTLVIIPIISNFKSTLKSNFILKVVIKLCLLINDIRLNEALRILSIRWLLSLRSNFSFNFNHYIKTISYFLSPTPFDSLNIKNEKIKTLFIFFQDNKSKGSEFIINTLDIFDNYKYYPIFSKHIKSLFKTYLFLVIRFPYKSVIKLLGIKITNNIKEVPRLLPNVINLLRNIKELSDSSVLLENNNQALNDGELIHMSFKEIYICLLEDMALFIANYNSHSRLNRYFELFIELSKENSIDPSNLIIAMKKVYGSIQDLRNWKEEKKILEVCRYLLEYHSLDTIKKKNIQTLLNDIKTKSFDYGTREQAKLYYELAKNVEKPLLVKFITAPTHQHTELDVTYNYCDYEDNLISILLLEQSKQERLEANLNDRGTAIYNCGSEPNMLFSSDYNAKDTQDNIIIREFDDNEVSYEKLNDYSKNEINELVDRFICTDDILRLFVSNNQMDVNKDALIPKEKVFYADNSNQSPLVGENNHEAENEDILSIDIMENNYRKMISDTSFYIKMPLNMSLKNSSSLSNGELKKMYSISLCFGSVAHLTSKSKIIIPYLETGIQTNNDNQYSFPYFYKTYLIIYPKLPIPTKIKTRAIFNDEIGKCCTGLLKPIHVLLEDYFLPITVPQKYKEHQNKFKLSLFKSLWKQFKSPTAQYVNTSRLLEFTKDIMISKVNKKLIPFLLNPSYEEQVYIIKNPYNDIGNKDLIDWQTVTKFTYSEQSGEFTKLSYDFIMENFFEMNLDKIALQKDNSIINGKYILAKAIIFLPEHYHILFKIKISDYSSIIEVRNDCIEILEYLDDYFDSWDK